VNAGIESLLSATAVRDRAHMIFARGIDGKLEHFTVQMDCLPAAAAYVAETIRQNYPDLKVPPHARWRHFMVKGVDRWAALPAAHHVDKDERARVRFELAITSVLLDAGAGPDWRWRDAVTDTYLTRSEGLAIASLAAFESGLFSSDPGQPMRADGTALKMLTAAQFGHSFQVHADNPLVGLDGRASLMRRLGETALANQTMFGRHARIGALYDRLVEAARGGKVKASQILDVLLRALGPVWADRLTLDGIPLGDTWRHPAIVVPGPTNGLMPFHKLSQWLAYSLIEPLQEAGWIVSDTEDLTGLPEYRNGGLFLDLSVIIPRDHALMQRALAPADVAVVEWRALTVALLDKLAPLVRTELGVTDAHMPLASILEGGTWAAGRRIAQEKRADGRPPLNIVSDGSVF
jgi:Protein of unknown function (DUF1688)